MTPFDPFPFPLLTMAVSLEAIILAWFVLASQNRLSRQRSHLNLQIDLLTEREMIAVLLRSAPRVSGRSLKSRARSLLDVRKTEVP